MRRTAERGSAGAFLAAAALLLGLCWFAHGVVLWLAAFAAGPLPAAQTALFFARQAMEGKAPAASEVAAPSEVGQDPAESEGSDPAAGIESSLVELESDDAKPENAGAVLEKSYPQGSGEKYVPCGSGSVKNNTRIPAEEVAEQLAQQLPFAVEWDSPDPQVLLLHTHATEDYRLSSGLWFRPEDGARSTDRALNMCAVGRVMADTLNAAGLNTLHDETLNDYPSYTGSYANSRAVAQQYLAQYPSIS